MTDKLELEIIVPDKILAKSMVSQAVVPGADGDFGVLPHHAPLLSSLRPGVLTIFQGDQASEMLFLHGGFAAIENNRCTILADNATPVTELKRDKIVSTIENLSQELRSADSIKEVQLRRDIQIAQAMLPFAG